MGGYTRDLLQRQGLFSYSRIKNSIVANEIEGQKDDRILYRNSALWQEIDLYLKEEYECFGERANYQKEVEKESV